ncbi:hypothetical protein ES703_36718 [subsurface metagenome]
MRRFRRFGKRGSGGGRPRTKTYKSKSSYSDFTGKKQRIIRIGNSEGIIISKKYMDHYDIEKGDFVEVDIKESFKARVQRIGNSSGFIIPRWNMLSLNLKVEDEVYVKIGDIDREDRKRYQEELKQKKEMAEYG